MSAVDCELARATAFDLSRQSADLREKAKESHRKRQGPTASYYTGRADDLSRKARKEHQRAADAIFERQNARHKGKNVIDLHGLHVDEGLKRLKRSINEMKFGEILIITGRGKNSRNHNGTLREIRTFIYGNKIFLGSGQL